MSRKLKPSKWTSPSGKVHHRRLRFYVGTAHEQKADGVSRAGRLDDIITLCGSRQPLTPAKRGSVVDCGVCLKAANTGAQN